MSIARAVTKRIKRPDAPKDKEPVSPLPTRSHTVKSPTNFDRSKISLPVALVSTTNMLSYNAPNIKSLQKDVPSSTSSSAEDSDNSISGRSRASSQSSRSTTLTDASSVAGSPTSPKPNHLSGFFPPPGKQLKKSASTTSLKQVKEEVVEPVPAIPSRALSHSKDAHVEVARKRSVRSKSTHIKSNSRGSIGQQPKPKEQRSSLDIFKGLSEKKDVHPFDRELKQLNEVAEEFIAVARDAEAESDLTVMRSMNLASFCAADYLAEIKPLFSNRFGHKAAPMAWI